MAAVSEEAGFEAGRNGRPASYPPERRSAGTQVWTKKKGRAIQPEKGALKVIRNRRRADSWAPSQS